MVAGMGGCMNIQQDFHSLKICVHFNFFYMQVSTQYMEFCGMLEGIFILLWIALIKHIEHSLKQFLLSLHVYQK